MAPRLWRIVSSGGLDQGLWAGDTPQEALLLLHRTAGYGNEIVWIAKTGELVFWDNDYRDLLGDVVDWRISLEQS